MGTRSDIIVQHANGIWKRIYCHWDGYLEHNGKLLAAHYNNQERAEAVVKEGDMSSLAEQCTRPKGHTFDTPVKGYCVYYGRDRKEKDVAGKVGASLAEVWPGGDTGTEYTYVWKINETGGAWYVGDADEGQQSLVLLDLALAGVAPPKPNVKAFGGNFVIGHRK
jgi:hypothetical protein